MSDVDMDDRSAVEQRIAGLVAFNTKRKQNSRENLLAAATRLFCRDGYASVAIEDITNEAGVSRITFYRHFPTKAAVAMELFHRAAADGGPHILAIGERDWRDRQTVALWLAEHFAAGREKQGILRVLSQANVAEADFTKAAQPFIPNMIAALGKSIPAFDIKDDSYRRAKAWLLIYTILDQSNRAATMPGNGNNPMMVEVLADSFVDFVRGGDQPPAAGVGGGEAD